MALPMGRPVPGGSDRPSPLHQALSGTPWQGLGMVGRLVGTVVMVGRRRRHRIVGPGTGDPDDTGESGVAEDLGEQLAAGVGGRGGDPAAGKRLGLLEVGRA